MPGYKHKNMKILSTSVTVFACMAFVGASFSFANAAVAAGFSYGSISVIPGSSQGLLTYRTLESSQSQLCDLTTFTCDPSVTSTPPAVTGEIGRENYTLSPSGNLALVSEASNTGSVLNNLYKVIDGRLKDPVTLPVAAGIYRILFTPDETRAVVRTGSALISINLQTNTIFGFVPWTAGDSFSFPQVSPDGRFVAYYSPATISAPTRNFRVADLLGSKTYTLSEEIGYWDLLSEENVLFQFSPDGKFLLYKDDRDGPQTLYKVDLTRLVNLPGQTFQGSRLFTKNYTVSDFILTDSGTLLYLANRETPMRFDLYSYDLVSETLKTVMTDVSYYPAMKRAGDLVLVNKLTSWGSQVMAYNPSSGTLNPLPAPTGNFAELKQGTDISLPNGLHGALLLPDNFRADVPHKFVVWLHGGPYRQASIGYHPYPSYGAYDWALEHLRSSGAVILKLDYSGSFAYGRPFAESIQNNVGVKDVEDVLASVASLRSRYNLSETYLMGVSYGGYLAMRSLVESPNTFKGAVSINGVSDWLTLVNRNPNTIFAADFQGPLTETNEHIYDRASIWGKIPDLTSQKIFLIHSTLDSQVSFSQSTKVADILGSAGKDVELIRLEDDDHVLRFADSVVTVCKTMFTSLGTGSGDKCTL